MLRNVATISGKKFVVKYRIMYCYKLLFKYLLMANNNCKFYLNKKIKFIFFYLTIKEKVFDVSSHSF